jgi:hypothetical protein
MVLSFILTTLALPGVNVGRPMRGSSRHCVSVAQASSLLEAC